MKGDFRSRLSWRIDAAFGRPIPGLFYAESGEAPDLPAPVTGLVLLPVGSGTVFATWEPAVRAENYRVTWKPTASSDPATEVGLFAETQATLTSLPAGVPITVAVSARNGSGETAPMEAAVML